MLHICKNIGLKFLFLSIFLYRYIFFLGTLVYYNNIRYVPIFYVAKIKLRYLSRWRFIVDSLLWPMRKRSWAATKMRSNSHILPLISQTDNVCSWPFMASNAIQCITRLITKCIKWGKWYLATVAAVSLHVRNSRVLSWVRI